MNYVFFADCPYYMDHTASNSLFQTKFQSNIMLFMISVGGAKTGLFDVGVKIVHGNKESQSIIVMRQILETILLLAIELR